MNRSRPLKPTAYAPSALAVAGLMLLASGAVEAQRRAREWKPKTPQG